jgi:hypothetical protein
LQLLLTRFQQGFLVHLFSYIEILRQSEVRGHPDYSLIRTTEAKDIAKRRRKLATKMNGKFNDRSSADGVHPASYPMGNKGVLSPESKRQEA